MRMYRSEKDGVTVWRLAGVMARTDALSLVRAMKGAGKRLRGCHVIDLADVMHVDYHAFRVLEERIPAGAGVVLSGMSDYVLDIFAFAGGKRHIDVYSGWREALRHIRHDRGKMIPSATQYCAGFK